MFRFFRSIRQSLLAENKTFKYLKYAVGEVLLIVIGILIALSLNNWNEDQKLELVRLKLVAGLITDFQINLDRAKEGQSQAENVIQNMMTMMDSVMGNDPNQNTESIAAFNKAMNFPLTYRPLLGRYNSAISDGSINLLNEPTLNELFIEFIETNGHFQRIRNFALENFFQGEIPALRRSVGSLPNHAVTVNELPNPEQFEMSVEEFLEWMKRKEVYASYENRMLMKASRRNRLSDIIPLCEQILAALEALD